MILLQLGVLFLAAHADLTECLHAQFDTFVLLAIDTRVLGLTVLAMIHQDLHDHVHHVLESKVTNTQIDIYAAHPLTDNARGLMLESVDIGLADGTDVEWCVLWRRVDQGQMLKLLLVLLFVLFIVI